MRVVAGLLLLAWMGCAQSQLQPPPPKQGEPTEAQAQGNEIAAPSTVDNTRPTQHEDSTTKTNDKKDRDANLISENSPIVRYTFWLVWFTAILALSTIGLWIVSIYTGIATRVTAKATKDSADVAFVASMPVLSPLVVVEHTNLHPLMPAASFNSHVAFVFENFGKTPARIREVRADLFLNEMDVFPTVEFEELPLIGYEPIVPGDSRGSSAMMGVAECDREFRLTTTEFEELLTEATTDRHRRFALIGQVTYDDFFGMRHTRRFCVKMRLMMRGERRGLFQLVRGGPTYNRITREKIPTEEI